MKDKILVLGNYTDAMYHPLQGVDKQLQTIFSDKELVCTDKTSTLLNLGKDNYIGIISYLDIWDSSLTDQEAIALYDYVINGGALLILHNGISIQSQENLKNMIGAAFVTHPPRENITFIVTPNEITKGSENFTLFEEPYQFDFVDDDKDIFLSYLYHGVTYAAGWKKCIGNGRLVFLAPGHTTEIFTCTEYITLIRNSLSWCLRKNK